MKGQICVRHRSIVNVKKWSFRCIRIRQQDYCDLCNFLIRQNISASICIVYLECAKKFMERRRLRDVGLYFTLFREVFFQDNFYFAMCSKNVLERQTDIRTNL